MNRASPLLAALLIAAGSFAHEPTGPQGSVVIDWSASNITRVVSSGYGDSFGMEADVLQGLPDVETVNGKRCIAGSYLLFDIDDHFAFDIDETVELNLQFADNGATRFAVAYDRNAQAETLTHLDMTESREGMIHQRITLDRARFANRGESGTDLMIGGASVYYPGTADSDHRVVLCGLTIERNNKTAARQASGRLDLRIVSENGELLEARVGIYDQSGRMPLPSDDATPIRFYDDTKRHIFLRMSHGKITPWPHENRHVFYSDGHYTADLPVGNYDLVVSRGPEYRMAIQTFTVTAEQPNKLTVELDRFIDMPSRGWYSGDDHVHIVRNEEDNPWIAGLLRAEDIHLTNVLQMGNPANPYFLQYAFGEDGRYFEGHHGLVSGIEDPRTALRGHTISLNIQSAYRPMGTYIEYEKTFEEYERQGAISGYAHVAGEWFNAARGLALDVPLGGVDFVEVLQDGTLGTDLWYDFLNLGFPLIPTAGSDFPYLNQPGAERNYVAIGDEFSADAWFANLAAGKTFVTNGPMLSLEVAGHSMGDLIEAEVGQQLDLMASARLNPDFEQLDRIELVINGDVVKTVKAHPSATAVALMHTVSVERGFWLAVRAYGHEEMAAHSAPVYVVTDERGFRADDKAVDIVKRMKTRLEEFETLAVDPRAELETWEVGPALTDMLQQQHQQILDQSDRARSVYDAIIEDIRSWN